MSNFEVNFLHHVISAPTHVSYPDHDVEQFEDDPLEFIRADLSLPSTSTGMASFSASGSADATTRRQAAADLVRALVSSGYETRTTEIVYTWVNLGLQVRCHNAPRVHTESK
jgi:exportin-2 (importin alpha re-exporter)